MKAERSSTLGNVITGIDNEEQVKYFDINVQAKNRVFAFEGAYPGDSAYVRPLLEQGGNV